jgi:hypothetical protein
MLTLASAARSCFGGEKHGIRFQAMRGTRRFGILRPYEGGRSMGSFPGLHPGLSPSVPLGQRLQVESYSQRSG